MSIASEPVIELPVLFQESETRLTMLLQDRVGPGTTDYTQLEKLPMINGSYVTGSHDGSYYGLVNSVPGKGLSDQNYSRAEKNKLSALPTNEVLNSAMNTKTNRIAMLELLSVLKDKRIITIAVYNRIVALL